MNYSFVPKDPGALIAGQRLAMVLPHIIEKLKVLDDPEADTCRFNHHVDVVRFSTLFLTREWGGVNKGCLSMFKHAVLMGWYPARPLAWLICQGYVDPFLGGSTAALADCRQPKLPPSSNS